MRLTTDGVVTVTNKNNSNTIIQFFMIKNIIILVDLLYECMGDLFYAKQKVLLA